MSTAEFTVIVPTHNRADLIEETLATLAEQRWDDGTWDILVLDNDCTDDTPEILADYAEHYAADPERWVFLTGTQDAIYTLIRSGMLLAVDRLPDSEAQLGMHVSHSAKLVVVDAEGQIRGWYDGRDPDALELCRDRVQFLDREASLPVASSDG